MTSVALSSNYSLLTIKASNTTSSLSWQRRRGQPFNNSGNNTNRWPATRQLFSNERVFKMSIVCCNSARKSSTTSASKSKQPPQEGDENTRRALQILLWTAEGVYILWLFLLPYAPAMSGWLCFLRAIYSYRVNRSWSGKGDPVWAISSDTVNSLVGLSLNFFFILPLMNSVGINLVDAPVLHPMSEGLFNFVIGWTFMFAPLLFTDQKRDRYKGSLDVLWGFQMFLTNTFLIPYMAIRLNDGNTEYVPRKPSQLGSVMTNGAPIVGLIGGAVCLASALWGLFGRMDGDFGTVADRWEFLVRYLGSERLAYAFIWDICLYIIFQPWLIGENLQNVQNSKVGIVTNLRFIPVVGLAAYLFFLNLDEEL